MNDIPTLRHFLGDGARAPGFEIFVRTVLERGKETPSPEERAVLRLLQIIAVAMIEGFRREQTEGGAISKPHAGWAAVSVLPTCTCSRSPWKKEMSARSRNSRSLKSPKGSWIISAAATNAGAEILQCKGGPTCR